MSQELASIEHLQKSQNNDEKSFINERLTLYIIVDENIIFCL